MFFNGSASYNVTHATHVAYSEKVFFCVLLALESIFGSAANFTIILVICCNSFLRTVENAFVVNLAIADFLISFVTQPQTLAGVLIGRQWFVDHPVLCLIVAQLCVCSCMATNSNTLLIAVNRYILICQPHLYSRIYTRVNVFLMCVAAWIGMFFISLPNHIGWGQMGFSDALFMCTFDSSNYSYSVFLMVGSVFLPASVTFPAYYGIYRKVRESRHRVLVGRMTHTPQRGSVSRKNVVTAKSLFKAYIVYLLLILPFGTVMVIGMGERMPHIWYMLTLLLYHGVGTVNCFAYAGRLGKFWDGFRLMFHLPTKASLVSPSQLSSLSQKSYRTT